MKVYIVETGEYSDRHIVAVFETEEKARVYCAIHNKPGDSAYFDEYFYNEWDTNDENINGDTEVGLAFPIWVLDAYEAKPERGEYHGFVTTRNNVDGRYIFVPNLNQKLAFKKAFKIFCDNKAAKKYDRVVRAKDDLIKESYKKHFVDYDAFHDKE